MFRKIVTELAYSPALAGSLGSYIKTLRNERSKRQIGLIFTILAVLVQLFATLLPPESANANNPAVFVEETITSIDDYLAYYDQNTKNIKDLMTSLGIPRSAIETAELSTLPADAKASIWSMKNNRDNENSAYFFKTASGTSLTAFYSDINHDSPMPEVYVSAIPDSNTWVAITKEGGNLITERREPSDCSTWFYYTKSFTCPSTLESSLSARAIMSSEPTINVAHASDRIAYTISITNTADSPASIAPAIYLEDILEYSRILENTGGEYDFDTKLLKWPTASLAAGESTERSFIVQLLPTIPSTAKGEYVTTSYDCVMHAASDTATSISVACPLTKKIEGLTNALPTTPKAVNLTFASALLLLSSFFYLRSRQLLTELYIIRHNHSGSL